MINSGFQRGTVVEMKRVVDDERMMHQVCDLYYNQNLGQREIAQVMNISRPTISRLLMNARQKGIVKIILADLSGRNHQNVELELEKKYNLKQAIVTEYFSDKDRQQDELGAAAAHFLERILKDGDVIGISMGTTLANVAPHVTADYIHNLTFVPMIGGVGEAAMELHSNYLAESLAKAFGGCSLSLHAPAMVSRIQSKDALMQEESIARVLSRASRLDVALSGIGAPDENSTIIATGYFNHVMIEDFDKNNICGDICLRFFDQYGNLSRYEHNHRVLGINVETLCKIPWSIGVAGGRRKANAIKGALAGKYINVLVTDIACAELLLDD